MGNKKILLGLTTTQKSDWKEKIKEIKKYGIKEIALFATGITKEIRNELYALLEEISDLKIPHVHIRDDFDKEELQYLIDKYNSFLFNIHPANSRYPCPVDYKKYRKKIYVENVKIAPSEEETSRHAGLCIDFSHLEDQRLKKNINYVKKINGLMNNYKIGCCHVSAIGDKLVEDEGISVLGEKEYSTHFYNDLNEFNYIKKYKSYLPEFISLELENSFKDQLEVKKYLDNTINKL